MMVVVKSKVEVEYQYLFLVFYVSFNHFVRSSPLMITLSSMDFNEEVAKIEVE